ncbi:uncharacterized protein Dwil_GK24527 [Drosophila willistoni]|uniref:Uncharacterized protein n=1 Tax=Drosophila willistoni TaxID=7260 RepID=B4N083_DROWI|nr:uncharacterized protein Dwil_GK24527 [Drosophila willistoni]
MDFTSYEILEAFFYPYGLPLNLQQLHNRRNAVVLANEHFEAFGEEGSRHWNRLTRNNSALVGGGDGPVPNPSDIILNGLEAPTLIVIHGKKVSSFPWSYLENATHILIILSRVMFKKIFDIFGIDMRSVFILGLSYNTYVTIFHS